MRGNSHVPIVCEGRRIGMADPACVRRLAQAPNVRLVRARSGEIRKVVLLPSEDDSITAERHGNPLKYSYKDESESNPQNSWALKHLPPFIRDFFAAVIGERIAEPMIERRDALIARYEELRQFFISSTSDPEGHTYLGINWNVRVGRARAGRQRTVTVEAKPAAILNEFRELNEWLEAMIERREELGQIILSWAAGLPPNEGCTYRGNKWDVHVTRAAWQRVVTLEGMAKLLELWGDEKFMNLCKIDPENLPADLRADPTMIRTSYGARHVRVGYTGAFEELAAGAKAARLAADKVAEPAAIIDKWGDLNYLLLGAAKPIIERREELKQIILSWAAKLPPNESCRYRISTAGELEVIYEQQQQANADQAG